MRIAIIGPWYSVHTEFWLRALAERGHEVHFLSANLVQADKLPEGVKAHDFSPRRGIRYTGQISKARVLRRLLRAIRPDVLHIHSAFAVRRWRDFPWLFTACTFKPLVLTAWGSDLRLYREGRLASRFLIKRALRAAAAVTGDSQELLEIAVTAGVKPERLHEVQFGVDTELFCPDVPTQHLREQLALGSGPVVFSPRAMTPLYNLLEIADAIPLVLSRIESCKFVFKSREDQHRPEYEAMLRDKLTALGVWDAVRVVPTVPYQQLPALYALSDVIVSVPFDDGTPRSVLEAMACGAFPIASDLPALREWIVHQENGLLVDPINPEHIADAILLALSNKGMVAQARKRNVELVHNRARASYWVDKLEKLYQTLAPTNGSANPK